MDQIGSELKKIIQAGFGAVSTGVEKSQEVIDKLAKKGEASYEQAKTFTKDAAEKVKKAYDGSCIPDLLSGKVKKEDIVESLKKLSADELTWLKGELDTLLADKAQQEQDAADNPPDDAQNADQDDNQDDANG